LEAWRFRATPRRCKFLCCGVFGGLYRASPDDFSSRLRLEGDWFLGEGIDAFVGFGGWLFDNDELGEAGYHKCSIPFDFPVPNVRQRRENALDIVSRQLTGVFLGDFLNKFRFGHQLVHVFLPFAGRTKMTTLPENR
jgi:hypothetical protein